MPSKNDNKRRSVWFPDDIWSEIVAAGKRDGRTASGWLRSRAERALAREAKRATSDTFRVRD